MVMYSGNPVKVPAPNMTKEQIGAWSVPFQVNWPGRSAFIIGLHLKYPDDDQVQTFLRKIMA